MTTKLNMNKTVKKSNSLNEIRNADVTSVEYKLFCVYLAHIAMNSDDNKVTFTLSDYVQLANLGRVRHSNMQEHAKIIVSKTMTIKNKDGGFSEVPVFNDFTVGKNEDGEWTVTLTCHEKVAPLIREQHNQFVRYKLYNIMFLKSYNQQRMYEILKQYESAKSRTISLEDLRAMLSIGKDEYAIWGDFSQKVLKVAQKTLRAGTDIYFDFEPVKKNRKVVSVKFFVYKNEDFLKKFHLEALPEDTSKNSIELNDDDQEIVVHAKTRTAEETEKRNSFGEDFMRKEFDEFSNEQLEELIDLSFKHIDKEEVESMNFYLQNIAEARSYVTANYIRQKILKANAMPADKIINRYAYIKAAVTNDYK